MLKLILERPCTLGKGLNLTEIFGLSNFSQSFNEQAVLRTSAEEIRQREHIELKVFVKFGDKFA